MLKLRKRHLAVKGFLVNKKARYMHNAGPIYSVNVRYYITNTLFSVSFTTHQNEGESGDGRAADFHFFWRRLAPPGK